MKNILSYDFHKVWTGQEIIDWIAENWNSSHAKFARQLNRMTIIPDRHYMIGKSSSGERWVFTIYRAD